jgi:hypothetical protein
MASASAANSTSVAQEMATHLPSLVAKCPLGAAKSLCDEPSFTHLAVHGKRRRQFFGATEHRLVQRRVHVLAFAGALFVAQRHQHPDAAVQAGHVVAQGRGARRHRRAAWHAGQVGNATHGMRDAGKAGAVLVGPGLAVACDTQHHQARVDLLQHVPAQAPLFQRAGAEVFAQHVGLLDQMLEHLGAVGGMRRSSVTERLLRDSLSQVSVSPRSTACQSGAVRRRRSGCSTFSTSAPNSPSKVAQKGAATTVATSMTRRPARGS